MSAQRTLIRAGRLVDVGAAQILADREVVIEGDRITEVRERGGTAPADERVIDLSAGTVLPGLIDLHAHLAGEADSGHGYADLVQRTGAQEALSGVENARATIRAGFTTVRDIGSFRAFVDVALRAAIERGAFPGPRMMCAGAYVTVSGGSGDITGLAPDVDAGVPRELRFGVADSADEVRRAVRQILQRGADFIKILATGAVLTSGTNPGACEFSEEEIRAAVDEAALHGTFVAAHAHGAEGIKRAVRAGVRSVEHGSLMDDEAIELMAERGTYLVADIYNGDWIAEHGGSHGWDADVMRKNELTTEAQREGFRKAVERGVRIGYGTDSGVYPHGQNARQLPYMVRYGLTPIEALRAATVVAAESMEWDDRIGSIAPGKLADIVAVRGHDLDDLTCFEDVAFVMKNGEVVKEAT